MGFLSILGTPLGWVMKFFYDLIGSYGWSLIIFIVLTRAIQFPLGIKQQKSTAKMANVQKKMKQLQKQFAKDKTRLNEEMMKLYEKEGVNPMGGCLPMLVTFVLLFGIIDVIYNPLKHLLRFPAETISNAITALGVGSSGAQLTIIQQIQSGTASPSLMAAFSPEQLSQINSFDMRFLGFNLGAVPTQVWGWLIVIPILSFVTQIASTFVTMKVQEQNGTTMQGMMKWTMYLMPLMSLWFAFTMPAGVGLYWTVSNILLIVQSILLQKMYPPEKMANIDDKASQKAREKMRKKREQMEMYAQMKATGATPTEAAVMAKQNVKTKEEKSSEKAEYKNKLAEARKRMAEKYGDE